MSEPEDWSSDWADAERQLLRNALDATPEQRLEWLEQAVRFAWETGALRRDINEKGGQMAAPSDDD